MRRRRPELVELAAELRVFDVTGLGSGQVRDAFTAWCATRRAHEQVSGWPGGGIRRLLDEAHVRHELRFTYAATPDDPSP